MPDAMNARIRRKLDYVKSGSLPSPILADQIMPDEEYFTAAEVGRRLKVHKNTVKQLMQCETQGVIRIGNRRHIERYSASAVERLVRRLERGEDPRYGDNST